MTIREWSPNREVSVLTMPCDRCGQPFHPPAREWFVCPVCAPGDRLGVPLMPVAAVLAAARKACATKPHHKPARRRVKAA
jgi:hypothetical protein